MPTERTLTAKGPPGKPSRSSLSVSMPKALLAQIDAIARKVDRSRWHYAVFTPAIRFEEWFRTRKQVKLAFYGHIRNGVSLPPGRDPEE